MIYLSKKLNLWILTEVKEEEDEYHSSEVHQAHGVQVEPKSRTAIQITVPSSGVQVLGQTIK